MKNDNKKIALYCRSNSEYQVEPGKDNQIIKQIFQLYGKCKGKIVGAYIDQGYSANDLKRPALANLIKDARRRIFDVVMITDLARLSRNEENHSKLSKTFKKCGIELKTLSGETELFSI